MVRKKNSVIWEPARVTEKFAEKRSDGYNVL